MTAARSPSGSPPEVVAIRLLLMTVFALLSSAAGAQSAVDSLPPIGARVRVIAPRLGSEWQVGMFNQLRLPSPCYRILLFTPAGTLRVRATLEPSELTRLQVAVGPDGQVRYDHPTGRSVASPGEQWREVPLALLEPSGRACRARFDSLPP